MDVNMNAEVKGYGAPVIPSPEMEARSRSRVAPVEESRDSSQASVDERLLTRRESYKEKADKPLTPEKVAKYVEEIQARFESLGTKLNFTTDEKTDSLVVLVTDRESGEVIQQIPSEMLLELKSKVNDLVGILFDTQV